MAGPGGGPPRKSHTKSRKGCKTCKRRHIRCDETFPQCRNCTKHSCRCDYMDRAAAVTGDSPRSPRAPDLLMTPEIEIEIDTWRMTGNPPFPELQLSSRSYWYQFSITELRLIHHIAGLSIDMHRRGYSNCTVWAQKMPIFLAIALSNDFVMSSIFALSASHLAWLTRSPETENLAYHYRGVAIKGLHQAISAFSRENSDAILASSMLLSWQATEWRTWASLQQGVSTVLNAMQPWWKEESELARFLDSQRSLRSARTPSTPSYPSTTGNFQEEDLIRLDHATAVLQSILQRISHNQEHYQRIADLLTFVRRLREDLPIQTPDQAFERLQTLRAWLFWLPPAMLRGGDTDLGALAVLSQFFGVALALEPLFPEIGGAYLGSMAVLPIEDIRRILLARKSSHPFAPDVQLAVSLMELPCEIVAEYRSRQQWSPRRSAEHYSPSPISPYLPLPSLQPPSATSTHSGVSTFTTSPIHSPASAPVSGSPYSRPTGFEPRRHSQQVYIASPTFPPDATDEHRPSLPEYTKQSPVGPSPIYSPAYVPGMVSGGNTMPPISQSLNFNEPPAVTMAGGFVAPELWT